MKNLTYLLCLTLIGTFCFATTICAAGDSANTQPSATATPASTNSDTQSNTTTSSALTTNEKVGYFLAGAATSGIVATLTVVGYICWYADGVSRSVGRR